MQINILIPDKYLKKVKRAFANEEDWDDITTIEQLKIEVEKVLKKFIRGKVKLSGTSEAIGLATESIIIEDDLVQFE